MRQSWLRALSYHGAVQHCRLCPAVAPERPAVQRGEHVSGAQVRLERVWGALQVPVTAKLDWVIHYTGEGASDLFEPALQAWEQAAAAVLERERSGCTCWAMQCSIHGRSWPDSSATT